MTPLLLETVMLSLEDSKRHLRYAFVCPADVNELRLHWQFSPPAAGELRTLITLSLEGPGGFRGAGHRHGARHEVVLSAQSATPGYLSGPIEPGEWVVTLHTHLVTGQTSGELRVTGAVNTDVAGPATLSGMVTPAPVPIASAAWMKGDLHCHTMHSDGRWTPGQLAAAATEQGLSFLALTDHNTLSGRANLAAAFAGLLLPGTELTTYYGHALVLGEQGFPGWTQLEPQRGMAALARRVALGSGYLVLAHPFAAGDPVCTGCAWTYFDLRPENATHLEVWNGPWTGRHNERALAYWYGLLATGQRVVATAGSDAHGPAYLPGVGFTCTPTTTDLAALLLQLREGQTYLSSGAEVHLRVEVQGETVRLGSSASPGSWEMSLDWDGAVQGSQLSLVIDGQRLTSTVTASGTQRGRFAVNAWLNVEIRGPDGELLLLTNPVYARR